MRVKICGITNLEDALAAEKAGADALGFNFVSTSKRLVSVDTVLTIGKALGVFTWRVGIFRNQNLGEVKEIAETLSLSAVQLHGDEDETYAAELRQSFPVIKAVSFTPELSLKYLEGFPADAILLDGLKPGSGEAFDWEAASFLKGFPRLMLAGGLTPDTVAASIRALHPYAVDVASGVEASAGIKDATKMKIFIQNAHQAAL